MILGERQAEPRSARLVSHTSDVSLLGLLSHDEPPPIPTLAKDLTFECDLTCCDSLSHEVPIGRVHMVRHASLSPSHRRCSAQPPPDALHRRIRWLHHLVEPPFFRFQLGTFTRSPPVCYLFLNFIANVISLTCLLSLICLTRVS